MDAILQTGIHQHGHAGIGDEGLGLHLLLTEQLASAPVNQAVVVGRYLAIVEGKLSLLPHVAPSFYHCGQQRGVVVVAGHVVLALIPDGTTHGVFDERAQLPVVEGCRAALLELFYVFLGDLLLYLGECLQPVSLHPCLAGRTAP